MEEVFVDVGPPLVAYREPPVAGQPRQRSLHHPPVTTELLAGIHPAPGDAALDAAPSERLAAPGEVVTLVGVQLHRALARSAPTRLANREGGVHGLLKDLRAVDVCGREHYRERHASSVRTRWRLEPGLPRSVGFLPTFSPPFWRARPPSPKTPSPSR